MNGFTKYLIINNKAYLFDSINGDVSNINIDTLSIDKLKTLCIQENIFDWKKEYINHNILDGTGWELELNIDGNYIKSYGINAFPKNFEIFEQILNKSFTSQ